MVLIDNCLYNDLNNWLNNYSRGLKINRREFIFGTEIVENLFSDYKIIKQFGIGDYFIDWYIPELNLGIEFDENHHKFNYIQDSIREKYIKEKLKCNFIRFKDKH
jgi:very-short-patch-repair endonuclease